MKTKKVLIGIQARSTSQRFPNKVMADLDGKPVLEHVVATCMNVREYMGKAKNDAVDVRVMLLIPKGDPLKQHFSNIVPVFEGDEHDVLARYWEAAQTDDFDKIVRITGDCPLIPPFVIVKHIKCAISYDTDYASNVDENYRTEIDGWDCEVLSIEGLSWLNDNAKNKDQREHVTTLMRQQPPGWAKIGHIIGFVDRSSMKLSVDTMQDLERVKLQTASLRDKLKRAYSNKKALVWRL